MHVLLFYNCVLTVVKYTDMLCYVIHLAVGCIFHQAAVTFPAAEHHRLLAGTKLYCLVTEAHRCEQFAQGCYAAFAPSRI